MGAWHGMNWCRLSLRGAIMSRDGWACVYCGTAKSLGLDHLKPRAKGGHNGPTNLVTCCRSCNAAKGDSKWMKFAANANTVAMINRVRYLSLDTRRKKMRQLLKEYGWKELKSIRT